MRKLQLIFILLLAFIACENREPDPVITPAWLEARIAELEGTGCQGCNIVRTTYNEEFYYTVYCNYWSCIECEVYHYNGNLVDWQVTDYTDYFKNKSNQIILWECPGNSKSQP